MQILKRSGQIFVEYAIVFTVLAGVIIWAGIHILRPAANNYFVTTGQIWDGASNVARRNFPGIGGGASTAQQQAPAPTTG